MIKNKKDTYSVSWDDKEWWIEEALLKQVSAHQYNKKYVESAFNTLRKIYPYKWIKKNQKHPIAVTLTALAVSHQWIDGDLNDVPPPGWFHLDPFYVVNEWIKTHPNEDTVPSFSHAEGINLFLFLIEYGSYIASELSDIVTIPNVNEVIAQLISKDESIKEHAESIVNIGRLLIGKGFEIEFEPRIRGVNKRPDIRVKKGIESFFVEVKKLREREEEKVFEKVKLFLHQKLREKELWVGESNRALSISFEKGLFSKVKNQKDGIDTTINEAVEKICNTISKFHNSPKLFGIEDVPNIARIEVRPSELGQIEYSGVRRSLKEESDRIMRNAFFEALKQLPKDEPGLVWIEHKLFPNLNLIESELKAIFKEDNLSNIIGTIFETSAPATSVGINGMAPVTLFISNPNCKYNFEMASFYELLKGL